MNTNHRSQAFGENLCARGTCLWICFPLHTVVQDMRKVQHCTGGMRVSHQPEPREHKVLSRLKAHKCSA